ncbi:O-methyltransferase-domain-containing protein [Aspergillus venezuelensis]
MEGIVSQIRTIAAEADSIGLAAIQDALCQLLRDLESPQNTLLWLYNDHLCIAVVHVEIRSGLFRSLSQSQSPLSVPQLADQTGTSTQLLERIALFLASNNVIDEAGKGQFKANKSTYILADPEAEAFASHAFDLAGPAIQALPSLIVETGYADITDAAKSPFQKAFNTDLPCFVKEALNADGDNEDVFSWTAVRDKYPSLKGQLIEANNMLQEQKVKGARFYYLRHVLHDFPDAKCVQILQHLRSAMTQGSRIPIDEVAVPEKNVPWQSAMADLSMMVLLGGRERTQEQWAMLAQTSSLQITEVHEYNEPRSLSWVIVLEMD